MTRDGNHLHASLTNPNLLPFAVLASGHVNYQGAALACPPFLVTQSPARFRLLLSLSAIVWLAGSVSHAAGHPTPKPFSRVRGGAGPKCGLRWQAHGSGWSALPLGITLVLGRLPGPCIVLISCRPTPPPGLRFGVWTRAAGMSLDRCSQQKLA